jgi:hypothetical protein
MITMVMTIFITGEAWGNHLSNVLSARTSSSQLRWDLFLAWPKMILMKVKMLGVASPLLPKG